MVTMSQQTRYEHDALYIREQSDLRSTPVLSTHPACWRYQSSQIRVDVSLVVGGSSQPGIPSQGVTLSDPAGRRDAPRPPGPPWRAQ